jgi:hypothetical protein
MNDRPDARELLGAVERFLREDVVPALDGPKRLHARVAANVVAMLGREIAQGDTELRAEWRGLAELLGRPDQAPADAAALHDAVRDANGELTRRIRAGDADAGPFRDAVIAHLKRSVDAKLAVSLGPAKEKR